jgi:hypothetical protein
VISGIINASNLMIYSDFSQDVGGNPACYLDTIPIGSFIANGLFLGYKNATAICVGGNVTNTILIGANPTLIPSVRNNIYIGAGTDYSNIIINSSTLFKNTIYATNIYASPVGGNTTLNIGPVNASFINLGNQNTSVNVSSGIINASYFTLSSANFNGLTNSCLLDTSVKDTLTTQMHLGLNNAEEIFIGNGTQNKKIDISTIPNTVNTITIGNASSTVTVGGTTNVNGRNHPLNVKHNSDYGVAIKPVDGTRIKRGNISLWGTFDTNGYSDYANRRCCDIYGGFSGGTWNTEYMSFGVGSEWVSPYTNDASNPTMERMRINATGVVNITGGIKVGAGKTITRFDAGTTNTNGGSYREVTFSTTFPTIPIVTTQVTTQDDTHFTVTNVNTITTTGFRVNAYVITNSGGLGFSQNNSMNIYWTAISYS